VEKVGRKPKRGRPWVKGKVGVLQYKALREGGVAVKKVKKLTKKQMYPGRSLLITSVQMLSGGPRGVSRVEKKKHARRGGEGGRKLGTLDQRAPLDSRDVRHDSSGNWNMKKRWEKTWGNSRRLTLRRKKRLPDKRGGGKMRVLVGSRKEQRIVRMRTGRGKGELGHIP